MKISDIPSNELAAFEAAFPAPQYTAQHVLMLYVTGTTPQSRRAIINLRMHCEQHLNGRYVLDVVDLAQRPALAEGEQAIAAPTLIKKLPLPLRRFIGDMSQTDRILLVLDLRKSAA